MNVVRTETRKRLEITEEGIVKDIRYYLEINKAGINPTSILRKEFGMDDVDIMDLVNHLEDKYWGGTYVAPNDLEVMNPNLTIRDIANHLINNAPKYEHGKR